MVTGYEIINESEKEVDLISNEFHPWLVLCFILSLKFLITCKYYTIVLGFLAFACTRPVPTKLLKPKISKYAQ